MNILVLGAGAVGGYFGGRMAEGGVDVTFLVRPRRQQQLADHGLVVKSPLGDIRMPVRTVLGDALTSDYDVVIVACKAYDLESSMDAIGGAVGRQTVIVPLLNGLAHLDRLDQRFGAERVMGGTCMIDATLGADGVVSHGGTLQRLFFGERDGTPSARSIALAAALSPVTFEWEQSPNIMQTLWDKLVFLGALATVTCLFRGNVREIMAAPGGRAAAERALAANLQIAAAAGFPCGEAATEFATSRLTQPDGAWSASMMRDMEAGAPVESDHIIGWLLEKARAYRVDDAMLALAFTHLKTYEQRRAAGRLPHG